MLSCAEVRPLLSFLLEKETGPLETLEARRHLDGCPGCQTRADRLSNVMAACTALPEQTPSVDLSSNVMSRLRSLKRAGAVTGSALEAPAARWGGLAVLLGAGLAMITRPAAPALKALGAPLAFLAGVFAGGDGAAAGPDFAGRAVAVALKFAGVAIRPEMTSGTGIDLVIVVQLMATALSIGLLLAIPVALLTAWFLHQGSSRSSSLGS
jgi:hypothetical protein